MCIRDRPWTAALATIAAGAMAGVPLLNGFLSKEMFFAETLQVQWLGSRYWVLPLAATLARRLLFFPIPSPPDPPRIPIPSFSLHTKNTIYTYTSHTRQSIYLL